MSRLILGVLVALFAVAAHAEERLATPGPTLGVSILSLDAAEPLFSQERTKAPTRVGVFVSEVERDGPAAKAGIKTGDVVHKVDGMVTDTVEGFRDVERQLEVGKPAKVEGYSSFRGATGKLIWKRGVVAITPVAPEEIKFAKMNSSTDAITGEKHFRHVKGPSGFLQRGLCVWYVQQDREPPVLWISFQWADAYKWLFFTDVALRCGDKTFSYGPLAASDVKRDNGDWGIAEWYAIPCGPKEKELVAAILDADAVTVRFKGMAERDLTFGPELKVRVRETIEAFEAAGGDWDAETVDK